MLNIHYTPRRRSRSARSHPRTPSVPISGYRDLYGNWCSRILAPAGRMRSRPTPSFPIAGEPMQSSPTPAQIPVEALPEEAIVFLLPSRFCDSDRLLDLAWTLFGHTPPGWARVQAICDYVHSTSPSAIDYARVTRTASEAYQEGQGVCRDYAHLAVAFCRCPEHSGALLHRLSRRRRHAAALSAGAISRPGSRPISAAAGTRSTRATTCRASAAS